MVADYIEQDYGAESSPLEVLAGGRAPPEEEHKVEVFRLVPVEDIDEMPSDDEIVLETIPMPTTWVEKRKDGSFNDWHDRALTSSNGTRVQAIEEMLIRADSDEEWDKVCQLLAKMQQE